MKTKWIAIIATIIFVLAAIATLKLAWLIFAAILIIALLIDKAGDA